jgi:hypothetical protein
MAASVSPSKGLKKPTPNKTFKGRELGEPFFQHCSFASFYGWKRDNHHEHNTHLLLDIVYRLDNHSNPGGQGCRSPIFLGLAMLVGMVSKNS